MAEGVGRRPADCEVPVILLVAVRHDVPQLVPERMPEAGEGGRVVEIAVENGEPVEFEQVLMYLEPVE